MAYVYDYYTIKVPADCIDTERDDAQEYLGRLAIDEARERARLYCVPCDWRATLAEGEPGDWFFEYRVRRRRAKVARIARNPALTA